MAELVRSENKKFYFRLLLLFAIGLVLNLLWENFHAGLYIHYRGGEITEIILLRAAVFDGLVILVASFVLFKIKRWRSYPSVLFLTLIVFALVLEWWALSTGRWAYNELMPIVPVLKVGLSPLLQLGLTGVIAYELTLKKYDQHFRV